MNFTLQSGAGCEAVVMAVVARLMRLRMALRARGGVTYVGVCAVPGNDIRPEDDAAVEEALTANRALQDRRTVARVLQRLLYAVVFRGDSSHLFQAGGAAGVDLSTLDAVHEESGPGLRWQTHRRALLL